MSTIEERRAGMIGSVTSGYRGTLASAERYRSRILQELPDIPYFTLQEQQEFIKTNGGNWDGQSFCGTTEGYPDGNCTRNSLEQIQNSRAVSNVPLLIPKKADGQEWTPIQLEALARQSIKVTKRASKDYTNFRGTKKYKQNVVYYVYADPPNYYQKYTQNGVPPIIYDDPQQKPLVTPVVLPDPSTSSSYRGNTLKYGKQEPEITTEEIDPYVPPTEKPFEKPERERVFGPEPEITTVHIEPQVVVEKPFEKPERVKVFGPEPEPEITTDHIEPPSEEQDFLPPEKIIDPDIIFEEPEPQVTTSQIEPPGVEEPEVITSQVEPPGQEVTAQISWFGNTWFPWHLELEDRRRR
jgi:hypothetical protein